MHRNRWVRRIAIGLFLVFVLSIVTFFYLRYSTRRDGNERLATVVSHLDETDPRWRLDDMEADRKTLNDDQNSALLVPRFKAALAKREFVLVRSEATKQGVFVDVPPNHVLDDEGAAAIDAAMEGNDVPLAIARSFKDYPRGQTRYTITPDVIGVPVAHAVDNRSATSRRGGRTPLPRWPAGRLPWNWRAMLGASRSIDGERFDFAKFAIGATARP